MLAVCGLMPKSGTVSFFLIGCRPSWYLSGRIELTLLIYKNLMFLIGLLKLNYRVYLGPFLDVFVVFTVFFWSSVFVDKGRALFLGLKLFNLSSSIYPYSGLLYEPDSFLFPHYIYSLLFFSSDINLTNGEF